MKQFLLLIKIKLQMWQNQVKRLTFFELLKFFALSSIGIFFFIGLHFGFYRILKYLETVPIIGKILILKLLAMIFLIFFLMLIFSNLITSLTTLFYAKDVPFLLSMPLSRRTIFIYKFAQTVFYSSWMVGITLLPFLLAYGRVKTLNIFFYLTSSLISLPFFLIAGCLGVILSLLLVHLFPSPRLRSFFLVFTILLGGIVYLLIRLLQPEELAKPDRLTEIIQYITFIQAPTATYLPSWWITSAISAYGISNLIDFRFYTLLLFGTGLLFLILVLGLAERIYSSAWLTLQSVNGKHYHRSSTYFPRHSQPLLIKERKIFFRDTNQWVPLFLLIPLVVVYLFNLYKLPLDTFYLKSLIAFLNIGLAGFVLAAVTLRFVFPAISLEGENLWILLSAPITIRKIIYTKFVFTFVPVFILAGLISLLSNWLLRVNTFIYLFSTGVILVFAFTLTSLGIGLGALYPKFAVENIAQIETSPGGIFYMLTALFYIGLTLSLLAWPIRMYFYHKLGKLNPFDYTTIVIIAVTLILLNLVAFFLPLFLGVKKLNNYEGG